MGGGTSEQSAQSAEEQYGGAERGGVWEGCRKRIIGILFGHRTLPVDRKMRLLAFLKIFDFWSARGTSISQGDRAPSPLGSWPNDTFELKPTGEIT